MSDPNEPSEMPADALPVHGTNPTDDRGGTIVEIDGVKFCQSHNGMATSLSPLSCTDRPPPIRKRPAQELVEGQGRRAMIWGMVGSQGSMAHGN